MKAKKSYGQHFLINEGVAEKISNSFSGPVTHLLEVGPGKGALTKYLINKQNIQFKAVEADRDMADFLSNKLFKERDGLILADFLKLDISHAFDGSPFHLIGNFPYNISSQIVFKLIENREYVPEMVGMFQKELAERIAAPHGSKTYGVISVFAQAYYDIELLFYVQPESFNPPPKVVSAVIRMTRKDNFSLPCNEKIFRTVVKQSFGQRRKMLRNTLKSLIQDELILATPLFSKRPEALAIDQFIEIVHIIEKQKNES